MTNLKERAGDQFESIFKSITSDNGSEFSGLHEGLSEVLDVYFTHPYASWERGTSENQHKFIRRFIPKGKSMSDLTQRDCLRIQQWMNDYPRKILVIKHFMKSLLKPSKNKKKGRTLSA